MGWRCLRVRIACADAAWPAWPSASLHLEVCGGIFVDEPSVVDGNLVTGRTFWDHGHYMGEWMKLLDAGRDQ